MASAFTAGRAPTLATSTDRGWYRERDSEGANRSSLEAAFETRFGPFFQAQEAAARRLVAPHLRHLPDAELARLGLSDADIQRIRASVHTATHL
ncbi:MAG: hypothetical protein AAGF32_03390 [Pseudomonadota bacterium]